MPRQNPARAVQSEANLARRIAYERERHQWSYEHLAQAMTDAGCPIQGSALYKIEKGKPRRRVTVDELVAFAAILDVPAQDLLRPVGMIGDREAEGIVDDWLAIQVQIGTLVVRAAELTDRLNALARSGTLWDYPIHKVLGSGLFRGIRKAQERATAAFELWLHEHQHPDGSASDTETASLISSARARTGTDPDGRSPTPKDTQR